MLTNAFVHKLECPAPLGDGDRRRLQEACQRIREVGARQDLIQEGEKYSYSYVVLSGFACRYKLTVSGKRQNIALMLPGDLSWQYGMFLERMDYSFGAISNCTVAEISHATMADLLRNYPRIAQALSWCALVDQAVSHQWLINMGQHQADKRLAHLLCEILVRLQAVGLADANSFNLPLTQGDLAETLGVSGVHINRMLQALRKADLIKWRGKRVTISDVDCLKAFCGFDANYLHLDLSLGREQAICA